MDDVTVSAAAVLVAAEREFGADLARAKMEVITRGVMILQLQDQITSLEAVIIGLQKEVSGEGQEAPEGGVGGVAAK